MYEVLFTLICIVLVIFGFLVSAYFINNMLTIKSKVLKFILFIIGGLVITVIYLIFTIFLLWPGV